MFDVHVARDGAPREGSALVEFPVGGAYLKAGAPSFDVDLGDGRRVLLFGEVFYEITGDGIHPIDGDPARLGALFRSKGLPEAIAALEGTYVGLLVGRDRMTVFQDRYARRDVFWARAADGEVRLSSDIEELAAFVDSRPDQAMLAHLFLVYGWYTPKSRTIYREIRRLGVGEMLVVTVDGVDSVRTPFEPLPILDDAEANLERYYEVLRDAIVSRAAASGMTWVSSSSGWDSSIITAILAQELGPDRVGMLAGSMRYSPQTDVINRFEMDKIDRIGAFLGIEPQVVEFDLVDPSSCEWWASVLPHFRSRQMYTLTTFNYARLSDRLATLAGTDATILNGETSDSFHNFGFSQFATFFHTEKSFSEYADKMNCWLFSPAFFRKVMDGSYPKDRVFRIFAKMTGVEFADAVGDRAERIEDFLFPLFYGSPRLPLAKTWINPALTTRGQEELRHFPYREYMPEVLEGLDETNLYAWYLYLYQSFHSQGSTVGVQKHAMEMNGHSTRQPFNDGRVIDVLSQAPTSWGRGLDLNHTKHPLKWVAANKVRFPYEVLETGPHSYLYDVMEGFSLLAEIVYRSGVATMLKEGVADRSYRELFDGEYVDVAYLDRLADDYLAGKEVAGQDFNNLVTLVTLCVTGWY